MADDILGSLDAESENPVRGWAVAVPLGYRVGCWEVTRPIATGAWGGVYAARARHDEDPAEAEDPNGSDTAADSDTAAGSDTAADSDAAADARAAAEVALKFIPTGTATPRLIAQLRDMVGREVLGHATLRHERLVATRDVLTVDDPARPELDGAAVLVMELADGSLADRLAARPGAPLPGGEQAMVQVCEGLAYMHEAGWVHGDLKPSNVLVRADGSCVLADFGLACLLDGTHAYAPPLSSPDYAPPERRTAEATVEGQVVRPSGDIWAFGVMACRVLTGRLPFPGEASWARVRAASEYAAGGRELSLSPELAPGWRALIADCLAAVPEQRPDATALLDRLRALPQSSPEGAGSQSAREGGVGPSRAGGSLIGRMLPRQRRPGWGRRLGLVTVGVAVLGAAGGALAYELAGSGGPSSSSAQTTMSTPRPSSAPTRVVAPPVPAGTCVPVKADKKDPFSGAVYHTLWFCNNARGAPQYLHPDTRTAVGWMITTKSWFLCYLRGDQPADHGVYYYTQGDMVTTGWRSKLAWGYTPSASVLASPHPYPGIPLCSSGSAG